MQDRKALLGAGIFGATGVALGAFGAHALRPFLAERGMAEVWETAVRYHLLHAVALLGWAAWLRGGRAPGAAMSPPSGESPPRRGCWVLRLWIPGIVLFSGSLYALALGAPRIIGIVTPFGGLALISGWIALAAAARRT